LNHVFSYLSAYLDQYGYWALFVSLFLEGVGVPMPGQMFLMMSAFYSTRGELNIIPVLLIAWAATLSGTAVGYGIGWYGGRKLILRFGQYVFLTRRRLDLVERFFRRRGKIVALLARFIDVSRQLNGLVSGVARMPWKRFLVYNALGAALWVCVWGLMSYHLGERVARVADIFKTKEFYLFLAVGVAIAVIGALLLRHHKKFP
jgi:membrane protein DedA with SNARE-associated domain